MKVKAVEREATSKKTSRFPCNNCSDFFTTKAAASSHKKTCQLIYCCFICTKRFKRKSNLSQHIKSCIKKSHNKWSCPSCDYQAKSKFVLRDHYTEAHDIDLTENQLEFDCWQAFDAWKKHWETQTKSQFICNGTHIKQNYKNHLYRCHRDGYFKSKGKSLRKSKELGSNKINTHCPARIVAKRNLINGNVKVKYSGTHVGHDFEIARLILRESEKYMIAKKLALNIPFEEILDEIRESVADKPLSRIHLLNRHDLWNVANSFKLNQEKYVYRMNYEDVDSWVEYMQSSSDIIKFYKPQGRLSDQYSQLNELDFLLVIMNEGQYDMLNKFGNNCVCVDGTNINNENGTQLYTVMVFDDIHQAFPCCFLFSNRHDTIAMQVLFQTIQISFSATSITPKSFMGDLNGIFYNTWKEVFGPVKHQLFNSWIVKTDWQNNLNRIENVATRDLIYSKLKMLMFDTDIDAFEACLMNFLNDLQLDLKTEEFYDYFQKNYKYNCQSWAYCFRERKGIGIKMKVGSVQEILKYIYGDTKKNQARQLGRAIVLTMKYIRDKLFNRLLVINKEKLPQKLEGLKSKHLQAQEIANDYTIISVKDYWKIKYRKNVYEIEMSNIDCDCELRCDGCNYCLHAFSCSCLDFYIKWNMCTHIHLLCDHLNNQEMNIEEASELNNVEIKSQVQTVEGEEIENGERLLQ